MTHQQSGDPYDDPFTELIRRAKSPAGSMLLRKKMFVIVIVDSRGRTLELTPSSFQGTHAEADITSTGADIILLSYSERPSAGAHITG